MYAHNDIMIWEGDRFRLFLDVGRLYALMFFNDQKINHLEKS